MAWRAWAVYFRIIIDNTTSRMRPRSIDVQKILFSNAVLWFFASPAISLFGQSLVVSAPSGSPGQSIAITVRLKLAAGQNPSTLSWETTFPAQLLEMAGTPESAKPGKKLACIARTTYCYRCILAGGTERIGDGQIATFHFRIKSDSRPGGATVRVDRIEAVSRDLETVKLMGSETSFEIRK